MAIEIGDEVAGSVVKGVGNRSLHAVHRGGGPTRRAAPNDHGKSLLPPPTVVSQAHSNNIKEVDPSPLFEHHFEVNGDGVLDVGRIVEVKYRHQLQVLDGVTNEPIYHDPIRALGLVDGPVTGLTEIVATSSLTPDVIEAFEDG